MTALGCLPPTVEPRATDHIEEMKAIIERLIASGHAYVAEDNVLFSVPSMKNYGKLSNRPLDEMIAGARVDVAPYKRDAMDFVLWKPSKLGEPSWSSPAGIKTPGRPGWHIECSAMSWKHLGETFDIHGGGIDLVFPHHENEIAQSCCAFDEKVMANFWMHNGFLQVEGEKMSKSLGNLVFVSDLLEVADPRAIRLALMHHHYRSGFEWHDTDIQDGPALLHRLLAAAGATSGPAPSVHAARVRAALDDDLDAPRALEALDDLASAILSGGDDPGAVRVLRELGSLIGVDLDRPVSVGADPIPA